MLTLIQYYWPWLLAALVIGFITGWWAWAHYGASANLDADTNYGTTTAKTDGNLGVTGAATGLAAGAATLAAGAASAAKSTAGKVADAGNAAVDGVKSTASAVVDAGSAAASSTKAAVTGAAGAAAGAVGAAAAGATALVKPKIAAAVGAPDNLLEIKGIGPKLNALCHSLGVSRFDQISKWTAADVAEVDQHLVGFHGRIERDKWIEQAKLLAVGDVKGFEAKFGKLNSENK